jgi:pimeloyl-ACP methyl ester carboxylesterase
MPDQGSPAGGHHAVERTFVGLPSPVVGRAGAGGHPCQGIYHAPAGGRPTTAFIATHYNVDFSEHYLAAYLAQRGYGFLGWNTRFRGAEAYFLLDHAVAEIAVGVRWLREQGIERVVLLGNSGGGSLMGAYHSQSVEPNIRPARDRTLLPEALDLAPCDLFVFVAAHPGRPEILTDWMDASVVDENDPLSRDPSLDPFDPGPPYDAEFVTRYRAAQRDRNARITAWCHAELDRLAAAGHEGGDRLFTTTRTWADLRMMDGALDPSDRRTPWSYAGDPRRANAGVFGIGTVSTCRSWLNMWSLTDSDCGAAPHLARLHLPTLIVHASADNGVFPSQAVALLDAVAATDKQLVTVTGDHYFQDPPGARDEVADLIAAWVAART